MDAEFDVGLHKKKSPLETIHKVNVASFTSIRARRGKVNRERANSVNVAAALHAMGTWACMIFLPIA